MSTPPDASVDLHRSHALSWYYITGTRNTCFSFVCGTAVYTKPQNHRCEERLAQHGPRLSVLRGRGVKCPDRRVLPAPDALPKRNTFKLVCV